MKDTSTNDILNKYGSQLDASSTINYSNVPKTSEISQEFTQFKQDMMPAFSQYERWCNNLGSFIKLKLAASDEARIQKELDSAHLDVLPGQVVSLSLISSFAVIAFGLLLTVLIYLFSATGSFSFLLVFLFLLAGGFLFYYFYSMPQRLANQWRLKVGSQMVPCILYTVIYMKHTSNLERAIRFASLHLDPPLALDLRKVFWDVETGKYSTMKDSLDSYLERWRETSPEFVESFNLIESSLFEPNEARRVQILERALTVILDGVYDKMLKYTHEVKAPLTNVYMLGIVLPTLGLALIPLASALLAGVFKWYHVFLLFNVIIPFFVFYMTNEIMIKRPGGYGESSILELNPMYPQYKSKKPYIKAALIAVPLFLLGTMPYLFYFTSLPSLFGLQSDYTFAQVGLGFMGDLKIFDYIEGSGPMGPLSLLFSLFIPLSVLVFFAVAYKAKTREIIKSRDYSRVLESEFNNSLFQLGNRIGDGTPAELAFGRVAENVRGQVTENFFRMVNSNIQSLGMNIEKAIFDSRRGAIISYPSSLISTSMHVLVESVKKGLKVAAQSLMSISDYVRNINKINERLRDLLADVLSDMKSNMTFLAPLLAGIVVGLGSMITLILSKLASILASASTGGEATGLGALGDIVNIFNVESMIPPYFLQICVGLYIVEVVFILTKALVTVDAGEDKLKETYEIAINLISAGWLYFIVTLLSVGLLSVIAAIALSNLTL